MTFQEIVQQVADDLNLTSSSALTRIGQHVNIKYRELVALPWMQISRRGEATQPVPLSGRYMLWPNCTKIYSIFDPLRDGMTLGEISFDEMRNATVMTEPPNNYAIARAGARSVTVMLDCAPTTAYTLSADVEKCTVTLTASDEPQFAENFHDILYYGAKGLELLKMEKGELAMEAQGQWDKRISAIKYHIASTAYLDYRQGKDSASYPAFINTIVQ